MKQILTFRTAICIAALIFTANFVSAQPTGRKNFDKSWKFHLGDVEQAQDPAFDDGDWRSLNLPHDWSIEGSFSPDNPAGYSGGALPGGIGWYRKTFTLPAADKGKELSIEFDGVYMNSKVWINGHYLGNRPYGYSTFFYDLTLYLQPGKNTIAVRVDNSVQPNSRWYSGSGIYRHVWLIASDKIHVAHWGTYITTPKISHDKATVKAVTTVRNETGSPEKVTLVSEILDGKGGKLASQKSTMEIPANRSADYTANLEVSHPELWGTDQPYLYKLVSRVYHGDRLKDTYTTRFGIRHFHFDADKGFFLNGKPLKILGVCDHHDLGCLGSAVNDRALRRQLEILKGAGVNALRTSHNPPAPELLALCDEMGILVMDEAFDCWYRAKTKYDYHLYFKDWHEKDLSDMLLRDRNHPSIILWSIGNEIPEQGSPDGGQIAAELSGIVKRYDTTRPVTSACNGVRSADKNGYAAALDVVGINYSIREYEKQHEEYPHRFFFGSETTSAVSSRGVYHMPADSLKLRTPDMQCSAYDNCRVPWGSTAEEGWRAIKDDDFMAGMFIWTGFDYIGEPTPYQYPAHSSYFGFIDLCGFPKDAYYFYQSQWTKKPMLHLLPHWNWQPGQTVDVWAYTNCDEVKLYLNDRPVGTQRFANPDQMHLSWKVPFEPGTLKAVGYRQGKIVATDIVKTAGAPYRIELSADRKMLKADGTDLSFITVKVVDQKGVMVPDADNLVHFELQGPAAIAGVDNGNAISLEPYKGDQRKAFNGMCLAVIQTTDKKGAIILKATSNGLKEASVTLESR